MPPQHAGATFIIELFDQFESEAAGYGSSLFAAFGAFRQMQMTTSRSDL